jgi:hypothetical protein
MMEKVIHELPVNELTVISITKEKELLLNWREENKEFEYAGKLYDLVKICNRSDSIILYCINDKQEEELFANLDIFVKRNTDNEPLQNKRVNIILEKLIKDYFRYDFFVSIIRPGREILFTFCYENLKPVYLKIITPPPKNYNFQDLTNNSYLSG